MRAKQPRGRRRSEGRHRRALPRLRSGVAAGLLLAALPLGGCGRGEAPRQGDPRIAAVENGLTNLLRIRDRDPERYTLRDRMEHYQVPGLSLAVIEGGRIAWVGAYGVTDTRKMEPVTPETLFQAASISKPLAALAALRLVEDGILELDAPANRYLRGWQIPENGFTARQPVTLRHLLTHTGGLTVHGFPGYPVDRALPDLMEILEGGPRSNTLPVHVDAIPGSLWRYSGGGYTVLQKLLEDVTGKPFPAILRELVLDPARMTLSSYEQPLLSERRTHAASGHLSDGSPVQGEWHVYPEMAAAGLWTNATELTHLALELQAAWRGEPGRILSPEMARAMLTPGMEGWGLGFTILEEGAPRFAHGGSNHGFKAQFVAFREEGRGAVVMTNGDQGSRLAQEIFQAVAEVYEWPIPGPREVEVMVLSPELLARVAGRYRIQVPDLTVVVSVEGDHLLVQAVEGTAGDRFFPLGETRFVDLSSGDELEAILDGAGRVMELVLLPGLRARRVEGEGEPEVG